MVSVVLDNLAAGRSPAEIATDYLMVTLEGVRATLAYAADLPPSLVRVASLDVELHA
jgi:uncharacterized protein (DUF433 family)